MFENCECVKREMSVSSFAVVRTVSFVVATYLLLTSGFMHYLLECF